MEKGACLTAPGPRESSRHAVSPAAAVASRGPWVPRSAKHDWRAFLTADEIATLAAADAAKAEWQRLSADRAKITNRAIQRAKYAAQHGGRS